MPEAPCRPEALAQGDADPRGTFGNIGDFRGCHSMLLGYWHLAGGDWDAEQHPAVHRAESDPALNMCRAKGETVT